MRLKLIMLCSCMFCLSLYGQITTVIPQSFLPGNASVAASDQWSIFHNPAALASETHYKVGILYENRYIVPELSNEAIYIALPTPYFQIGLSYSFFGYSVYNEMLAALSIARSFGKFRLGIECLYYTMYLSETERYQGTVTAQVGVQVDVIEQLTIGFNIFNPVFSKVETLPETRLPVIFSIGTDYRFHHQLAWLVEVSKDLTTPLRVGTGITYRPVKELKVGVGVLVWQSVRPNLTVGLFYKGLNLEVQSSYQYPLGFMLSGCFSYTFP